MHMVGWKQVTNDRKHGGLELVLLGWRSKHSLDGHACLESFVIGLNSCIGVYIKHGNVCLYYSILLKVL